MTSMLHQIARWVTTHPKIWRFVCFVSSIVGLLCYALSSSFNHLFGKWNILKVFLYGVFSLIICIVILFANTCYTSGTSLRVKAHLVFSVFTITTVYSFFFDKANGKPDLYSLISCAAFAIMSLSLSKQTHLGFEVDLLYFFCAYLTIQLMKIKLFLVIVGIIFSYSLIIFRFYLGTATESEYLRLQFQDEQSVVIPVHSDFELSSTSQVMDFYQTNNAEESSEGDPNMNFDAHHEESDLGLVAQIDFSSQGNSDCEYISLEECKIELAGMNLELNLVILWQLTKIMQCNFPDANIWKAMSKSKWMTDVNKNLHKTVKKMMEAGFQTECFNTYNIFRSKFLNKCLCTLGLQELNLQDVDHENIGNLMRSFQIVLGILLPNERRIRYRVFSGFSLEYCIFTSSELRRMEIELWVKFMELQSCVCFELLRIRIRSCEVHQLTSGVMNSIKDASKDRDNIAYFNFPTIIHLLQTTLEAKSKSFINPISGYLFVLNNNRYIQLATRYKTLQTLLGEDWTQLQTSKVNQNIRHYIRCSWNEVLTLLKNNDSMAPNVAIEVMKLFHLGFSKLCKAQATCFVVDEWLKETMRRCVKKMLLPVYEKFIGRFKDVLGKDVADQHIKYGISDIEDRLDYLFSGSEWSNESRNQRSQGIKLRKKSSISGHYSY